MNTSNVVPLMNKVEKQAKVNYGPWCYNSDDLQGGRNGSLERHGVVGWTDENIFMRGRVNDTRKILFMIFLFY